MRLLDDLYVRRFRRQHPGGDLEPLSGRISDTNRAVSAFRFANHLKGEAVEWMERIENTNLLGFCAQGIVSVVTITRICIDRKSTRLNSSHSGESRMPSSA